MRKIALHFEQTSYIVQVNKLFATVSTFYENPHATKNIDGNMFIITSRHFIVTLRKNGRADIFYPKRVIVISAVVRK